MGLDNEIDRGHLLYISFRTPRVSEDNVITDNTIMIPTALVQVSGLQELTKLEFRLWLKLIDVLQNNGAEVIKDNGTRLKIFAGNLLEDGESDRSRLIERLRKLSSISIEANLDGRDNNVLWRYSLKLVSEYELKSNDAYVYISVGNNFYQAVRDKSTYTKLRSAALFEMKSSKYSSRLYTLIRDKINQDNAYWSISVSGLRVLLQVKEGAYDKFSDFRMWVLDKAVEEINDVSELEVSWRKSLTFKKKVLDICFEWKLKDISMARSAARALDYKRPRKGALFVEQEKVIIQSEIVKRAIRELSYADIFIRQQWANRYVKLGYGQEFNGMCAKENLERWVDDRLAEIMKDEGFI